jgi:hypothetical protein
MAKQSEKPRFRGVINEAKPYSFRTSWGTFTFDWRAIWLIAIILIILVFTRKVAISDPIGALIMAFGLLGIYGLFIHAKLFNNGNSAAVTKFYQSGARQARSAAGHGKYRSDELGIGSSPTMPRRRAKKSKVFGRLDPVAHVTTDDDEKRKVLGLWYDHRYGTWSVTLSLAMSSFFSDDLAERTRRLANFTHMLDLLAEHGGIKRFSVKILTFVGESIDPDELVERISGEMHLQPRAGPGREVFNKRVAEMGEESLRNRLLFTFTFLDKHLKPEAKELGSYEAAIEHELDGLFSLVMGEDGADSPIGVNRAAWLSYNNQILTTLLLTDHFTGKLAWSDWLGRVRKPTDLFEEWEALPTSIDFDTSPSWGRLGDTYVRTFAANRFNSGGMSDDALWRIIHCRVPKAVNIVFEMLPAETAQKRAERRAAVAEEEMEHGGYRKSAGLQRSRRVAQELEQEIASGEHETGRVQLYVTLFGHDPKELDRNQKPLEAAWKRSRIRLVHMSGDQHRGAETLPPIGRGIQDVFAIKTPGA